MLDTLFFFFSFSIFPSSSSGRCFFFFFSCLKKKKKAGFDSALEGWLFRLVGCKILAWTFRARREDLEF